MDGLREVAKRRRAELVGRTRNMPRSRAPAGPGPGGRSPQGRLGESSDVAQGGEASLESITQALPYLYYTSEPRLCQKYLDEKKKVSSFSRFSAYIRFVFILLVLYRM